MLNYCGRYSMILWSSLSTGLLIIIIAVGLISCTGCKEEIVDASPLHGKWNVYDATRNGRSTTTLKDAYFYFVNDTLLLSNILREEESFSYKYMGDRIMVSGPLEATYVVSMRGSDSLNLYGEIEGYDFGFYTMRDTMPTLLESIPVQ